LRAGLRGSFLYSSAAERDVVSYAACCARALSPIQVRDPLISSVLLYSSSPGIPGIQEIDRNVLAARVLASELMPYAMTRPVMIPLAPLYPSVSFRAGSRSDIHPEVGSEGVVPAV
jgi:hypothetical protein